ncbi:hypothetical protein [Microcoleus anatoxicus]|uniref:hypothetical protein n=1 Tax=Microcoleus anatoxicus TaxID=2705319 RepID=UPI0030C9AEF8
MGFPSNEILPLLDPNKCYEAVVLGLVLNNGHFVWETPFTLIAESLPSDAHGQGNWSSGSNNGFNATLADYVGGTTLNPTFIESHIPSTSLFLANGSYKLNYKAFGQIDSNSNLQFLNMPFEYFYFDNGAPGASFIRGRGSEISDFIRSRVNSVKKIEVSIFEIPCQDKNTSDPLNPPIRIVPVPPPSSSPPVPNPPPTKKKMSDCCEITKALQLETLRMLGRQVVNGKLQPITNVKGFLGEEIARIETPIKDPTKPKTIKLKFNSIYELLVYCLKQSNNLDTALDPQSYKPVEGNLQNPEYRRDTKHSLTNNRQPDNDASGRKREFKINKDEEVIFRGFLQEQKYIFEAIKRFEYLFPYGEFSNFKIDQSLIVPSTKKAEMQVHNTFHAFEVLFQYLNSSLGNPREEIHIGDTNPGKEGSQPITFTPFSVSHLMREVFKYLVDLEGDQDSQLNLALRDFRTNLANRVQIVQIHEMAKALFEDTGMVEQQDFVTVKLEGDPYAGNFKNGEFLPSEELDENTEEATERLLAATLQNFEMRVKVLRRDNKKDPNDLRDVIIELYNKLVEQSGGTAGGDDLIKKELEKAKFNVELDGALTRVNVKKAQAASSYKTRKKRR